MSQIKECTQVFLRSIPAVETNSVADFMAGAEMVLRCLQSSSDDPIALDKKDADGLTHIFLVYGEWIGPHKASFPGFEHLDWGHDLIYEPKE